MEQKIKIRNQDYSIHAILSIPEDKDQSYPVVVMLHGTASDKHEVNGSYDQLAKKLLEGKIASIRFDFIGTGESEVNYIHYCFSSALSDVESVFHWIQVHEQLNFNRIGVMGWSQGGSIALLSSARFSQVKSLVTWAASINIGHSLVNQKMREEMEKEGYTLLKFTWRKPLKLSMKWYQEAIMTKIITEFEKSTAPILAIHGKNDEVVSFEEGNQIINASKNKQSKFILMSEADHVFHAFEEKNELIECIHETVQWFVNTL